MFHFLSYISVRKTRKQVFLGVTVLLFTPLYAKTSLQLGDSTGLAGNTVDVSLHLSTGDAVSGAQIDLYADPAIA
jgi:hypothetical protein